MCMCDSWWTKFNKCENFSCLWEMKINVFLVLCIMVLKLGMFHWKFCDKCWEVYLCIIVKLWFLSLSQLFSFLGDQGHLSNLTPIFISKHSNPPSSSHSHATLHSHTHILQFHLLQSLHAPSLAILGIF